jgi:hypothetical protein
VDHLSHPLDFTWGFFFFFFAVLGFEFRASCLLGRCPTTWIMPPVRLKLFKMICKNHSLHSLFFVCLFVCESVFYVKSKNKLTKTPQSLIECPLYTTSNLGRDTKVNEIWPLPLNTSISTMQHFFLFLLFIYAYNVWVISSPFPLSPPFSPAPSLPPTPSLPGRNYFALISNFLEERV